MLLREDPSAPAMPSASPSMYDPRLVQHMPYGYPAYPAYATPAAAVPAAPAAPVRTVITEPARQTTRTRVVERAPGRNWKKTAAVIGGSSAAGAGVGAIFGGKKGALIGAAIGGGASTIYEATK
jgi:hypothetical protein